MAKINENRRKLTKTKSLSFAFFYFLDSGLFKGLRRIQMDFFSSRRAARLRLASPASANRSRNPPIAHVRAARRRQFFHHAQSSFPLRPPAGAI